MKELHIRFAPSPVQSGLPAAPAQSAAPGVRGA